jgi:hypothetical protein
MVIKSLFFFVGDFTVMENWWSEIVALKPYRAEIGGLK